MQPDLLQSLAISTVCAGNAGITPFLSLFTLSALGWGGAVNTSDWLSAPSTFGALLVLTVIEFLAKCVPALDSVVDNAMTFVVPFVSCISVLANMPEQLESEGRRLFEEFPYFNWLLVAQFFLLSFGALLAIVVHLTKILVRLAGVGWLTSTLTVIESVFVAVTTVTAVYIRPFCVVFALVFLLVLLKWMFGRLERVWEGCRKRCRRRKKKGKLLLG